MINGINNVINAAYPRYAYPCFTTANNPNCAIANAKNVKISVAMAFLTKCPFRLSCSDLIRRSTALTHLVTIPEIMFTAVEIDPRMIKTEMIGVNNPEDTPFCTKTNIGTVAVTRSAAYATANNPMMDNSIAKKLNTKISMAALLICFLSVTGSICWYITDTDANWKKKYKTAEYKAGPKAPLSPEITGIFPDTKLEIAAVIASHCTMMFGTNTRTNPIKISTLKVDAHFLTTLVPKSAITKINAAMINVHTQYGIPNSI